MSGRATGDARRPAHSDEKQSSQEQPAARATEEAVKSFWKDGPRAPHVALASRKSAPGRAVMRQSVRPSNDPGHRRNNSTSFESFAASCADAWDSNVEDCVGSFEELTLDEPERDGPLLLKPRRTVPGTASALRSASEKDVSATAAAAPAPAPSCDADPKLSKFRRLVLEDDVADLNQLRSMAWAGIPSEVRPVTWKLLLGYVPAAKARRSQVLERKRSEYDHLVHQYYNNKSTNDEMWRQIHIDIPRMQPLIAIFQQEVVQQTFERVLYIWSIRHPASGYVQGMNDLVTPFFVTYLSEFIPGHSLTDVESLQVASLPDSVLRAVEADSFWSFSKLLDSIQDNYTFAQPGIQRLVNLLSRVMSRVDAGLHDHLTRNSVQYLQFAFRWMNNLLIRELPLRCIVRLWDTYLAEGAAPAAAVLPAAAQAVPTTDASPSPSSSSSPLDSNPWSVGNGTPFSCSFHLFVCAAFLRFWSKNLMREQDFQGLMLLLQNLPTFHWSDKEIRLMVADAYQLKYTFTPNHLNS